MNKHIRVKDKQHWLWVRSLFGVVNNMTGYFVEGYRKDYYNGEFDPGSG